MSKHMLSRAYTLVVMTNSVFNILNNLIYEVCILLYNVLLIFPYDQRDVGY